MTPLQENIKHYLSDKNAQLGVSVCDYLGTKLVELNADKHFPMQSVYKFHLALVVMSEIDKNNLSLNQIITISKDLVESYQSLWSPIKLLFPKKTNFTLAEMIVFLVSESDNLACDLLFNLVGGVKFVAEYFSKIGISELSIAHNELTMQTNWDNQFLNCTTPAASSDLLKRFYNQELLSRPSTNFLFEIMTKATSHKKRLAALLPEETVVAHKSGSSGVSKEGIRAAVNDIGIIFLPDGNPFYISVFITDTSESLDNCQTIIAEIGLRCWKFLSGVIC
jgi:beta-lactamase class A